MDHSTIPNNLDSIDENINEETIAEDRMSEIASGGDDMIASASRVLYSKVYDTMIEIPVTALPSMDEYHGAPKYNPKYNPFSSLLEKQFSVDPKTGEIRVLRPVIYSEKPVILTIRVSDGVHKTNCKVKINVRDVNNNDPIFNQLVYYANISEIAEIGQFVIQIQAHDADTALNAQIVYTMSPNLDEIDNVNTASDFVIDNRTGIITVNNHLDFDRKNVYSFKLKAEDCGVPKRHTITTLVINVLNENNKNPYFKPSTQMCEINEHTSVGTKVYKLIAEDPDILVQQRLQQINKYAYRSSPMHDKNSAFNLNDNSLKENEMLNFRIENIVALNKDGLQVEPGKRKKLIYLFFFLTLNCSILILRKSSWSRS